jgi:hypothetical protein
MTPGEHRDSQLRRCRIVRLGVVAAGTTGALGAAVAIGASLHTAGAATPTVPDDQGSDQARQRQQPQGQPDQSDQPGQLAAPGGSGPAQGRTGGS